ncbi:MAG: DNA-processing protein DprA [Acidimicrobiales bacterium]
MTAPADPRRGLPAGAAAFTDGAAAVDAHLTALVSLPGLGPRRLGQLLAACPDPVELWQLLAGPGAPAPALRSAALGPKTAELLRQWAVAGRGVDPALLGDAHRRAGVRLLRRGGPGYPARLADDLHSPLVLFSTGDLSILDGPTVAIVGTRRATPYGLNLARRWAAELTEAGVAVVSGLARGIDAAAHDGALRALEAEPASPVPIGVVGTGLDVVYPRSSRLLWRAVAQRGLLLSEAPLGTQAERWRFPARNRIIAGLADAVLVVESHERGGALSTAEEALDRNRPVLAVPGSVHAEASAGTNRLIQEGSGLARSVLDVLEALPLGARPAAGRSGKVDPRRPERCAPRGYQPSAEEQTLLDALGWDPATLDVLVARLGWPLGITCRVVESLTTHNLVMHRGPHILQVRE